MSLYERLKLVTFGTLSEAKTAKTSQTSHARAGRRSVERPFSFNSDGWDTQTLETDENIPSRAQVTFGTLSDLEIERKVIAWINAHPPDLPLHQNNCAVCGEFIPVDETGWIILGDGALIHRKCWDRWHRLQRERGEQWWREKCGL